MVLYDMANDFWPGGKQHPCRNASGRWSGWRDASNWEGVKFVECRDCGARITEGGTLFVIAETKAEARR
jgi:hypothetical protein